jgi:hypothetical protein
MFALRQGDCSKGLVHGFYYTTKSGTYTDLDGPAPGTEVWGVNDNDVVVASVPEAESSIYCLKSKGCPAGAKFHQPQPPRGPARPEHWAPMP